MDFKYRFKGHETFALREGWLTKGLVAVESDPLVFSRNKGADALGVGTNMANAIKYYLKASGLIKEIPGKGNFLSDLGRTIYDNDRYFEDDFSLWLVHINLVFNFQQATSWSLFFNSLDANTFSRKQLEDTMINLAIRETSNDDPTTSSIVSDCAVILSMYTENKRTPHDPEDKLISPFAHLGLIKLVDRDTFIKNLPSLSTIHEDVLMYIIQTSFMSDTSIGIDDLVEKANQPGKVLNLSRVAVNNYLDKLSDQNRITVNRTAGLDVVYKAIDISPLQVVKEHYERISYK